ncbi:hypothetical protein B7486_14185 [cyanobacterium TDX16]|nr:hypothetical protein B7486_14185 [cyanobacterium TDX16]
MKKQDVIQTVRVVPPEDVRVGDYVVVMHVVMEHLMDSCAVESWKGIEQVRMLWMPWEVSAPMKVVQVCLPFVLVKKPDRKHVPLDTRRYRLARIPGEFGRTAFRKLQAGRVSSE